jgi:uncharacterized membrane protein
MYRALVLAAAIMAAMMASLMAVLLAVMRPMWRDEEDATAARHLQDFLARASRNPLLIAFTVLPWLVGLAVLLIGAPSDGQRALAGAGGAVYLAGFTLWTVAFNLPLYRVVARWRLMPGAPAPSNFGTVLSSFHRANAVRLTAALTAAVLFLLAA